MKKHFRKIIEEVEEKYNKLVYSKVFRCSSVPFHYDGKSGIYVFYENSLPVYVGRANNIRQRLQQHAHRSHMQATFAFLLARHKTGILKASYKPSGSRDDLLKNNPKFAAEFDAARDRIRHMDIRVVEETHPIKQAILEIYTTFVSEAKYNDFGTS